MIREAFVENQQLRSLLMWMDDGVHLRSPPKRDTGHNRDNSLAKGVNQDQAQEKHDDQPTMQAVAENYSENCGVDD
ncbi:hypothetical protein CMV_006406 [Castanea mollissima]|uniref:Uncharacterized protein n=1 Tax=Castanea mollissima TaxID=60419 RepID=A0A8J4VTF9_9ROSI|nr:hypothetical protein CMV_006406 [Castanea mollissima]